MNSSELPFFQNVPAKVSAKVDECGATAPPLNLDDFSPEWSEFTAYSYMSFHNLLFSTLEFTSQNPPGLISRRNEGVRLPESRERKNLFR